MAIVDREIRLSAMVFAKSTLRLISRLVAAGLLFVLIAVSDAAAQIVSGQLQRDYDNGLFETALEGAKSQIGRETRAPLTLTPALLAANSLIMLERHDEARQFLDTARLAAEKPKNFSAFTNAKIFFGYSAVERARGDFRAAIGFARRARFASPNDARIESEYYFSIGRILYSLGHDVSATIWLEKAEKLIGPHGEVELKIDVYRYLGLAAAARFDYAEAISYHEKRIALSRGSRFSYKHRLALYELGSLLTACGRKKSGAKLLGTALDLSVTARNVYLAKMALTPLLLSALYDGNVESAESHLRRLEQIDVERSFGYEILLGRAVLASFKGQKDTSERNFVELTKQKEYSALLIPSWRATIAEKNRDWEELLAQGTLLLKLAEEKNFRDELPSVYLLIAKAYQGKGEIEKAEKVAKLTISMVEEARNSGDASFSFGMMETYHTAYRLLAELRVTDPVASFELADFAKARVLKDRIDTSALRSKPAVPAEKRKRIEVLSKKFIEDGSAGELEAAEKEIAKEGTTGVGLEEFAEQLKSISGLSGVAIVSYLFTSGGHLLAHVWTKDRPLRIAKLPIAERDAEALAVATTGKIRNLVFFKKDGKEIYDRLLAPLDIDAERLIIVPDKSLWRIPFHALSEDGSSYMIEKKLISYSPSIATLLASLKRPAVPRKSIQAFANSLYRDRRLRYVDGEAKSIAGMFGGLPILNANAPDFLSRSGEADILHLAMHAEVDSEEPLHSFLAFRPAGSHDGRITVEDLLRVRLKRQSLVFLASCDTNNVLNGEGLVSIAWAMLGAGSTSVVSAQWEANDKSTAIFGDLFYRRLREGRSVAEAMQDASVGMIRNKSSGFHEPYYWAAFNLLGDFR